MPGGDSAGAFTAVIFNGISILREEQGETVLADLNVSVVVRVRIRHVDAWEIDSRILHVFTVAEEAVDARPR